MAQMALADFDAELISRGFDALDQTTRFRMINWAYKKIAKRFYWRWEKTAVSLTLNPGSSSFTLTGATPDIPNFRRVDAVVVTTNNFRRKLRRLSEEEFLEEWLPRDLTTAANRGEPGYFYTDNDRLYILPPPQASRDFSLRIRRRVTDLTTTSPGVSDVPITPPDLDHAILLATLVNAHNRVHEVQLAANADAELREYYDLELTEDDMDTDEAQLRVEPDNSWL